VDNIPAPRIKDLLEFVSVDSSWLAPCSACAVDRCARDSRHGSVKPELLWHANNRTMEANTLLMLSAAVSVKNVL